MRRWAAVLAVALGCAAASPAAAAADDPQTVLVTFSSEAAADRATAEGGALDQADDGADAIAEEVAVADLTAAEIADVRDDPAVVAVEPDGRVSAAEIPNDPCMSIPTCPTHGVWHVEEINLPAAWDVSHGTGAVIAVLDGGLDELTPVPDLAGKIIGELDMTGGSVECPEHATHIAALAAAGTNNMIRIPGAGWDAQILSVQVLFGPTLQHCSGLESNVIEGISAAIAHDVDVINLSLGMPGLSTAFRSAIDNAIAAGIVVVAAAGNGVNGVGTDNPSAGDGGYPAAYPPVIAVGASSQNDTRAFFSNFGDWVDVFAPGDSLQDTQDIGLIHGTSYAAPIVSGVVALLRAARPSLTPGAVHSVLLRTADPLPTGIDRVNAGAALQDDAPFSSSGPGVAGREVAVLELAETDSAGTTWTRTLTGEPTGWAALGGFALGDPDITSTQAGRVEVVVRGGDSGGWIRQRIGSTWQAWRPTGGRFSVSLSMVATSPSRVDLFGRGTDGAVWHAFMQNNVMSAWERLGGSVIGGPDAAAFGLGQIAVFAQGADRALWYRRWNGAVWLPWASLGGTLTADPGAVSWGAGRFDVVVRGTDGAIWHRGGDGAAFSPWQSLGGFQLSAGDAATRGPGTLDVIVRAVDGYLWRRSFTGGSWSSWQPAAT